MYKAVTTHKPNLKSTDLYPVQFKKVFHLVTINFIPKKKRSTFLH